jgi:hypothetical protein
MARRFAPPSRVLTGEEGNVIVVDVTQPVAWFAPREYTEATGLSFAKLDIATTVIQWIARFAHASNHCIPTFVTLFKDRVATQ